MAGPFDYIVQGAQLKRFRALYDAFAQAAKTGSWRGRAAGEIYAIGNLRKRFLKTPASVPTGRETRTIPADTQRPQRRTAKVDCSETNSFCSNYDDDGDGVFRFRSGRDEDGSFWAYRGRYSRPDLHVDRRKTRSESDRLRRALG